MGAFEGLRSIRQEVARSANPDMASVITLVRRLDPDARALDFDAAIELNRIVDAASATDPPHEFYRCCIKDAILVHRMTWARTIVLGRAHLIRQLGRDEQQCFRAAQLMDSPPSEGTFEWWNSLDNQMRWFMDQKKREGSRMAEKLSLAHEVLRLKAMGIMKQPQWVAIEDNTVGYDILSYDSGQFGPVNRLIEVKSTVWSPLRFIVSRNEWAQGVKFGAAYHFHIWDLAQSPPRLYERTLAQVLPHIPSDNEKGKWTNASIPVGPS